MTKVRLTDVELSCRIDGTGPPILFLHGAGGSSLSWFQQIPTFARYFTCVAIDHPGFGLSGSSQVPLATILDELLRRFQWERVGLVAHSLGGWSALRLAISDQRRIGALVLSSTWAGLRLPDVLRILAEREAPLAEERRRWRESLPGSYLPGLGARLALEQPELHWLAAGISAVNRGAGQAVWTRDATGNFDQVLLPETQPAEVVNWSVPTLCLSGTDDIVVPPLAVEMVANHLRGARFHVIGEAGHSLFLERPSVFNALVLPFLCEHLGVQKDDALK